MSTTTFENAQVGDKVWSLTGGWGEIIEIDGDPAYPITIKYDNSGRGTFTSNGYLHTTHVTRNLFWDEIRIIAPSKPMPKLAVDTKVLVWDNDKRLASKRYFSHFDAHGRIYAFTRGATSWSSHGDTVSYSHWELAE